MNDTQSRIDALLRVAGSNNIEADIPEGLAAAGMSRWQTRQRRRAMTIRAGAALAFTVALSIWLGFTTHDGRPVSRVSATNASIRTAQVGKSNEPTGAAPVAEIGRA